MSQTFSQAQSARNLQFTQQAFNHLRNLRDKQKKQNPSSIYDIVKFIYSFLKDPIVAKMAPLETISATDYLGNSRDSIEEMLIFIRNKICSHSEQNYQSLEQTHQVMECPVSQNQGIKVSHLKEPQSQVSQMLKQKEQQIQKLLEQIKIFEETSKSMKMKLLNNVKRLTLQIQQKDVELKEVRKILQEKEQEIQDMCLLNEKKHKKMRKLEEDIYDLRIELAQKNDELQAERDCADFLQKKVDKLMSLPTQAPYSKSGLQLKTVQADSQTVEELSHCQL